MFNSKYLSKGINHPSLWRNNEEWYPKDNGNVKKKTGDKIDFQDLKIISCLVKNHYKCNDINNDNYPP